MAAALFSAAAHISAVWPRELSRAFDVGAGCEQRLQHRDIARSCGRHQHRFAARQRRVRIGAAFEQPLDDVARCRWWPASESGVTP